MDILALVLVALPELLEPFGFVRLQFEHLPFALDEVLLAALLGLGGLLQQLVREQEKALRRLAVPTLHLQVANHVSGSVYVREGDRK